MKKINQLNQLINKDITDIINRLELCWEEGVVHLDENNLHYFPHSETIIYASFMDSNGNITMLVECATTEEGYSCGRSPVLLIRKQNGVLLFWQEKSYETYSSGMGLIERYATNDWGLYETEDGEKPKIPINKLNQILSENEFSEVVGWNGKTLSSLSDVCEKIYGGTEGNSIQLYKESRQILEIEMALGINLKGWQWRIDSDGDITYLDLEMDRSFLDVSCLLSLPKITDLRAPCSVKNALKLEYIYSGKFHRVDYI